MDSAPRVIQTLTGVLQKTSGRDKIARILQYGGLFIAWLIKKYNLPPSASRFGKLWLLSRVTRELEWSDSILNVSSNAGSARKVFRLFGYIEQLRSAGNALALIDPYKRGLVSFAKLCSALYLFCDNMVWVHSVGILKIDVDNWKKYEYRFWLAQLTLNLTRDCYEWLLLVKREYNRLYAADVGEVIPLEDKSFHTRISEILSQNRDLTMDTLANFLDVLIPLNRLEYLHFPDGIVGMIGLITSILRLIPIASPAYKLPFS